MKYLLDAVVILIFLLAVWRGHKRGFIKTVTGIVAFVAALAVALLLDQAVAGLVYDKVIEPPIVATVEEQLAAGGDTASEALENAYSALPEIAKNLLTQVGVADAEDLAQKISVNTDTPLSQSVAGILRPVLLPLIQAVCSLLLFLLAYIVASIVLRMLNVVAKLPLLKQLNKSLGLVAGVLSGALWALLAVTVIQVLAATGTADSVINLNILSETVVVNWLAGINPLGGALQEILTV